VLSARTVVPPRALDRRSSAAHARWHRIAVASAKQCGRAVVPEIAEPTIIGQLLESRDSSCRLMLTEPGAAGDADRSGPPPDEPASAILLVGPEGGWAPAEVSTAVEWGWRTWSLGRTTIRADAAALVALGALAHAWRR
jgi:16S rRNA (uracil1498-N3)-methyltransferase